MDKLPKPTASALNMRNPSLCVYAGVWFMWGSVNEIPRKIKFEYFNRELRLRSLDNMKQIKKLNLLLIQIKYLLLGHCFRIHSKPAVGHI